MVSDADIRAVILASATLAEARARVRALYPTESPSEALVRDLLEEAVGGDLLLDPLPPAIAKARAHLDQLT